MHHINTQYHEITPFAAQS